MELITIVPNSLHTLNGLWGFSIKEDAGAAAVIRFRLNGSGGQLVATVGLSSNESAMIIFPRPVSGDIYVEEASGSIEGVLYST